MKNSLKLVVGVLFMVLMIGQANADARSDSVARNQDRENPMQEANKIDPADLIKKGLGTILPNIFR